MIDFDGRLFVNAKGLKLVYNLFAVIWLWMTRKNRKGHWYFDA